MKRPRLDAIEYIRGISMLGVIGIHIGSQYLINPTPNLHLVALLEIVTRFSVPIFFFISAFGLFYNMDMNKPFTMADYKEFLIRRGKTVMIPYIVWSMFYMLHNGLLFQYLSYLTPGGILSNLVFGNGSYQLYFMVLLLWFYLFMPLWIIMVKWCTPERLVLLAVIQIAINYALDILINPYYMEPSILKTLLTYRLNYWVIYYFFIFVLGGWLAVNFETFQQIMKDYRRTIIISFWTTMIALLGYYYKIVLINELPPLAGVFTAHQLCPIGVLYTIAASLFFFTIFTEWRLPGSIRSCLSLLGKHSYFAYLAHPIAITYCMLCLERMNIVMSAGPTAALYIAVVLMTMLMAAGCRRLGEIVPAINKLTIGIYPRKK